MDYLIFTIIVLTAFAGLHLWLRRSGHQMRPPRWLEVALATLLIAGWVFTRNAGDRARRQIQEELEGLPPTYAEETERMGHAGVTTNTSPDDPAYLAIIAAQIRWERANPVIADIYTLRKRADGRNVLIVDSETDYNRNGKLEGGREDRTPIGEVYSKDIPALEKAFEGTPSFMDKPYTDRWGTWVSAFVPLRDGEGRVEAVLGVDYPGANWIRKISEARLKAMSGVSILAIFLGAASTVIALLRANLREWELAQERISRINSELEGRVRERTARLEQTTEALQTENRQRRQAEEALIQQVIRCKTLMEMSGDSIHLLDETGDLLEANPAFYRGLGYTAAEMAGMNVADWEARWNREELRERIRAIEKQSVRFETKHRRKDGSVFEVEAGVTRIAIQGQAILFCITRDISDRKQVEFDLEQTHNQLLSASRQAALAEFATGVLHNVGNVVNNVNISATCVSDGLKNSKLGNLAQVVALIHEHQADLGTFFSQDSRGKKVPGYVAKLAKHLTGEQASALKELRNLQQNIEHIKTIITVQQDSAKMSRPPEQLRLTALVEDALKMNANSLQRGGIQVVKEFEEVSPIVTEKHKVLQILVNLVRNAMQACEDSKSREKRITTRISRQAGGVCVAVADNGSGILPENLPRIFAHGFTTKKEGHGFGLHSAALAAKELGGTLTVESKGAGEGATFTLELPSTMQQDAPWGTDQTKPGLAVMA